MAMKHFGGTASAADFGGYMYVPTVPEPALVCPRCGCESCGCCGCGDAVSPTGVRYSNGSIALSGGHTPAQGFGHAMGHTLTYSSQLGEWDFGNGFNWMVEQWPFLIRHVDEMTSEEYIVFVKSPSDAVWFDLAPSKNASIPPPPRIANSSGGSATSTTWFFATATRRIRRMARSTSGFSPFKTPIGTSQP